MKQSAIAALVIGCLMFLFGLIRFNSAASQFVRAFGGSDGLGMFLLVAGGILAVGGAFAAFNDSDTQADADTGTNKCPSCGRYNFLEATSCEYCSHVLTKPLSDNVAKTRSDIVNPSVSTGNYIEQLERLASLKERGALSDEEFQQQKEKLLGLG